MFLSDRTRKSPAATGLRHSQHHSGPDYTANLRALYQGDPRIGFIDAMRAAGIVVGEPDRIVGDGCLHRFHVEGDKRGSRNGWAILHLDHTACGAFGHWRTGLSQSWCSGSRERLSPADRARMDAAIADAKRKHDAERLEAAKAAQARAAKLWAQAASPAAHPYLIAKGVQAHGIRQLNNLLLIPLRDGAGVLWNVQTITPDGTKRFLTGGRKRGLYHAIGASVAGELCIGEGYGTAASVHEATGQPVAVAFDCGNLEPVAKVLRAKYPQAVITLCADNDTGTEGNPGLTAARAAARAVGGKVAIPPESFNDFNDAMRAGAP